MRRGLAVFVLGFAGCGGGSGDGDADTSAETSSGSSTDTGGTGDTGEDQTTEGWDCQPPFCGDLPAPIECGNGKLEKGEECEGDVANATCEDCNVVCMSGYWDCNDDPEDGCEIDTESDVLNCGACGHDCQGSQCGDGACLPLVIAQNEVAPMNVATDATHVYWTNDDASGSVVRAELDGSARTQLTTATSPFDLAVDGDDVFYSADDEIRSVPKGGGASSQLIAGTGAGRGIAIDATDVYYVDLGNNAGVVERIGKLGGGETTLTPNQDSPRFLTVVDGFVYWTDDVAETISRTATDGMGAVEVLSTSQVGAWDVTSTPDIVSWTNLADVGQIGWLSLTDLEDERILDYPARPWGVTRDDVYIYWTAEGDGKIGRSEIDGEQELPQTVVDGQTSPHGIANTDDFVFWADTDAGTIVRWTK